MLAAAAKWLRELIPRRLFNIVVNPHKLYNDYYTIDAGDYIIRPDDYDAVYKLHYVTLTADMIVRYPRRVSYLKYINTPVYVYYKLYFGDRFRSASYGIDTNDSFGALIVLDGGRFVKIRRGTISAARANAPYSVGYSAVFYKVDFCTRALRRS